MIHNKDNNKPLFIPESKKVRGLGLVVYCYKCQTNMFDICKETGRTLKHCPNGDKHVFKVYIHVPGTKNERRTKKLDTRDLNEAIRQAIAFNEEVKNNIPQKTDENIKKIIIA